MKSLGRMTRICVANYMWVLHNRLDEGWNLDQRKFFVGFTEMIDDRQIADESFNSEDGAGI